MRNKRIAVAFLVLLMIGVVALPAFARGPTCSYCDDGELIRQGDKYTDWERIGKQRCPIKPSEYDYLDRRLVITVWKCNSCGISDVWESPEYRVICGH